APKPKPAKGGTGGGDEAGRGGGREGPAHGGDLAAAEAQGGAVAAAGRHPAPAAAAAAAGPDLDGRLRPRTGRVDHHRPPEEHQPPGRSGRINDGETLVI